MLNRHIKQVPVDRERRANKPTRPSHLCVALPHPDANPYDLEPGFEFLRSLIEARVLKRLEEIFEKVRRIEELNNYRVAVGRRAIRLREVLHMLGISKSTLYGRLNPASSSYDPVMPKAFKLGTTERSISLWWDTEVIAYLESCAQASRNS